MLSNTISRFKEYICDMAILCIETATPICSVALVWEGEVRSLAEIQEPNRHASDLHLLVDQCLKKADIPFSAIKAVCVSKGPGSYTGLRVGVSAAKGYAYALQIPLLSVFTLQALAAVALDKNPALIPSDAFLIPMLDARRMEVYSGIYDSQLHEIRANAPEIITADYFDKFSSKKVHVFGNGAAKCLPFIASDSIVFHPEIEASAAGMKDLAQQKWDSQQFEDIAYFEPYYLKAFVGNKSN